jgi:hypothetical protein
VTDGIGEQLAVQLLMMSEMLGRLAALMGGYKRQLIEEQLSEEAAEEMAADFHRAWVGKFMAVPAAGV